MTARVKAEAENLVKEANAKALAANASRDQALAKEKIAGLVMVRANEEAKKAGEATARLQHIPSLIRVLWDGFRKSELRERIMRSVEAEFDRLRSLASTASARASEADAGRRRAEDRARSL